jgi:predicted ATPase
MLTKWKLFNFKSVQTETELSLAPLTIFAGPNSSGKSTWIQSILLISQTLASKFPSPAAVVLNGNLAKLGQFDDLRSYNSEADQILIGWECQPLNPQLSAQVESLEFGTSRIVISDGTPKTVLGEVYFEADSSSTDTDISQLQPRLSRYSMSCLAEDEDSLDTISRITVNLTPKLLGSKIAELGVSQSDIDAVRNSLNHDITLNDVAIRDFKFNRFISRDIPEREVEAVGCDFNHHFLPSSLTVRYNAIAEAVNLFLSILRGEPVRYIAIDKYKEIVIPQAINDWLRSHLESAPGEQFAGYQMISEERNILFWARQSRHHNQIGILRKLRTELSQEEMEELQEKLYEVFGEEIKNQYGLRKQSLPTALHTSAKYLDSFFSTSVKYLGPLRDEPKPLYPLSYTLDPSDIGLKGEYTAAVLDRYKDKLITYIPTANFPTTKDGAPLNQDSSTRTLKAAVTDWLKYLEIADDLRTKDMGKLGHELKVTLPGLDQEQDLMHVGVGVSQVVPILVLCLLAEPDTTLIFEQPELHLHPLVQTRLADFFLSMSLLGKQCIIETHSEYLINRLRFRVAADPVAQPQGTLAEKLKIYFAEKIAGASQYREVTVNKYGAIVDWPQGFFDQSQREAEEILRASMTKRQQERQTRQQARQQQEDQTDAQP